MKTTACNEIVIEYPGYIQSFGYLLGINVSNDKVEFFSENVLSLLDVSQEILGINVNTFNNLAFISNSQHFRFLKLSADEDVKYIDRVLLNNKEYHITYYRHLDIIYIELEECILDAKDNSVLVKKIKNLVSYRQGSNIWEFLVDKIKEITDYDRVMIYQFNEDKSGKVVAEAKNANMESFLNLHYPESDIPSQARALYLKNFKRILSDVHDTPIKLFSKQKNVDLSLSSVRSLSPIHIEYLINAKISSSFSISIIIDNQLWGLVTCHNTYQKHIDLDHRLSAEIATFIAANSYHSYLSSNAMVFENILQEKCFQLKKDFLSYQNISDSLTKNIERLRLVSETDGLAVIIDGQISKSGSVPDNEIIKRIAEWGITNIEEEMYYSDTFFNEFGEILGLDKKLLWNCNFVH
ncbi:GAF domain-containing protein [Epilithonimonas sp.]|uniref:GAF domain-containing protein n=1 Tax=Epilithonimonas sp. TaxID=2894511 RepID=UPI00289A856E|nr:GAF domain-containing protein [Epilithonimonas sp.]